MQEKIDIAERLDRHRRNVENMKKRHDKYDKERRYYKAKCERLLGALKPFADAVYNDNGDVTINQCSIGDYMRAARVYKEEGE